jgi:hypothetical protein
MYLRFTYNDETNSVKPTATKTMPATKAILSDAEEHWMPLWKEPYEQMPVQPGRMKMMIDPLILIIKQTEHLIIEDKLLI